MGVVVACIAVDLEMRCYKTFLRAILKKSHGNYIISKQTQKM